MSTRTDDQAPIAGAANLRAALFSRLIRRIKCGRISIELPTGHQIRHSGAAEGPTAVLVLHRWRAIRRLLTGGDVAWADAYVDGDWSSPDIVALIELVARNRGAFEAVLSGMLPLQAVGRLRHWLRANTRAGSRRNVAFHYDLGNDFYRLWLGRAMLYSSALYSHAGQTLEEAQDAKLERIMGLLNLEGGERVLEIGCGWGELAARLGTVVRSVLAVTVSAEQRSLAEEHVEEVGLSERVKIGLADYRDLRGSFDRIVSIEMIEAVGEQYWPAYFQVLRERLAQDGSIVLQAITIEEDHFQSYRLAPDFIQRRIFPGGMLPTRTAIAEQARSAGLQLVSTERFGASYALTLNEWRRRFVEAWPDIEALGFDERFRKLWTYYLSYCEAGFRSGAIDVGFFVLRRRGEGDR